MINVFLLLLSGELDCWVTGDVLGQMMLARDDTGRGMTNLELEDEVMTLMLAGFEVSLQDNYVLLDSDGQLDANYQTFIGMNWLFLYFRRHLQAWLGYCYHWHSILIYKRKHV